MSLKEVLVESFVKGIGKTSGALVVCGVIGSLWGFFITLSYTLEEKSKVNDEKSKVNDEKSNLNMNYEEYYKDSDLEEKFKVIFDNL